MPRPTDSAGFGDGVGVDMEAGVGVGDRSPVAPEQAAATSRMPMVASHRALLRLHSLIIFDL
jgi:hypothetical protein